MVKYLLGGEFNHVELAPNLEREKLLSKAYVLYEAISGFTPDLRTWDV